MIIYPAMDLRDGNVVRLERGNPKMQTVFSNDPLGTAQRWLDEGAEWLHVINLNGAFGEQNDNLKILEATAKLPIKIQFGGGIRSFDDIEMALKLGASRVVLGTFALERPANIGVAIRRFGVDKICIALDAREGQLVMQGWSTTTNLNVFEFGEQLAEKGVEHVMFTDISRDGRMIGINVEDTVRLGRETGLKVIASGGLMNANGITRLARSKAVSGVIVGMALYTGQIMFKEALLAASSSGG